ncbi:hypothetical protein QBC34DRAFT_419470 [Podospora aff. communis PSN243]|uniref:HNH nuclease domain-containing protein n=1 Tax=Podospora aff. communis PSN243 TaxID=3040156 RepID=A0AAV9FYI4_9PEZI|nr:hypothetical protein QBC34DRAFT_419470 [Podospora aff. communis PSN243]
MDTDDTCTTADEVIDESLDMYLATIDKLARLWVKNQQGKKLESAKVKSWYKKCALTGATELVEGAHIFDVFAQDRLDQGGTYVWDLLRRFWPMERLVSLEVKGQQLDNILRLRVDAHRLWDKHRFGLRPIRHHTDPHYRLFVQVVWFDNIIEEGKLVKGEWDHRCRGTISDSRRGDPKNHCFPAIEHGDVYEIVTTDPEERPLPNEYLLAINYSVQKILAGMQAAGALKDIFHGPPPAPTMAKTPSAFESCLPLLWSELIQEAEFQGVLTKASASAWRRYVSEVEYQSRQEGGYS